MRLLVCGIAGGLLFVLLGGGGARRVGRAVDAWVRGLAKMVLGLLLVALAGRGEMFAGWLGGAMWLSGGALLAAGALQVTGWVSVGKRGGGGS